MWTVATLRGGCGPCWLVCACVCSWFLPGVQIRRECDGGERGLLSPYSSGLSGGAVFLSLCLFLSPPSRSEEHTSELQSR